MKPELSIIIPIYNGQQHINGCLDSILYQNKIQDCEIIIVNDGSTDNSFKIIKEYASRYDNIVPISGPNQGVSWARNKGIEHASGKYLTFIDIDDRVGISYDSIKNSFNHCYNNTRDGFKISNRPLKRKETIKYTFEKDYFAKMLSVAQRSGSDVALAGKFTINQDDRSIKQHVYTQDKIYSNSAEEQAILVTHSEKRESANFALYRRDFLDKNNLYFQPEMKLDEDILFCMQSVLCSDKTATVADATYFYNRHTNSLSNFPETLTHKHKYTVSNIQRYSAFLHFIKNNTKYSELFNLYLKKFAIFRDKVTLRNRYYFPSCVCYGCLNKTCEDCLQKENEVHRIKENISELLPGFLQQYETQKVR